LRLLERNLKAIHAAGADVLVLTADSPEVITAADLDLAVASVSPSLWGELGLTNPDSPQLPHPATLIIDPSGRVLLRQIHVNYRERTPVTEMIAALEASTAAPTAAPTPAEAAAEDDPDWSRGVTLRASGADDCLSLTVDIAEGFHLYGAREPFARPLSVTVDQAPEWRIHIPDGTEKVLPGIGASWVLEGRFTMEWPLPEGLPRELTGTIGYQLCTDTSCSPPAEAPLSVTRIAGPCTTPDQLE
jgi:hypothetical protein